jgi:hypothetical protein
MFDLEKNMSRPKPKYREGDEFLYTDTVGERIEMTLTRLEYNENELIRIGWWYFFDCEPQEEGEDFEGLLFETDVTNYLTMR